MVESGLRKSIVVPSDTWVRVDAFRFREHLRTEQEAMLRLITAGLDAFGDGVDRVVIRTGGEGTPGETQNAVATYTPPAAVASPRQRKPKYVYRVDAAEDVGGVAGGDPDGATDGGE